MLYGRFEHTVDAKNRMFVPAKFKEAMGTSFKVTYNEFTKCIMAYSEEEWEKYEKKLSELPSLQFEDFIRTVYSNTVDVAVDSQGRIIIPQFLKDKVGIQKNVLVVGVQNRMEIWASDEFEENHKTVDLKKMRALMEQVGF
ncbi:MAG: division/cell wall cluster transcriptional repressor MraZ [Clostridia bacterium]|nr:division/cell wall cluster transcriptional repressor MraZ [Clostridia bacterium]